MKRIGKAKFNLNGFEAFSKFYTDNFRNLNETINRFRVKYLKEKEEEGTKDTENNSSEIDWHKIYEKIQDKYFGWTGHHNKKYPETMLSEMKRFYEYIVSIGGAFFLIAIHDDIAFITYGKADNLFPIYNYKEYLDIEIDPDYSAFTIDSLKQVAAIENNSAMGLILHSGLSTTSLKGLNESKEELEEKVNRVKRQMEDVKEARSGELANVKAEVEKLKAQMKKKEEELQAKIRDQMEIIEEKKRELEEQVREMELKIKVMDSTIYTIRCFLGETYELAKIRDGARVSIDCPLVVNQKLKFLDEELAKLISVYDVDGEDYRIIEDLLKYNDTAFEYFCPQDKCISFVKVSRDNRGFCEGVGKGVEGSTQILKSYEYLHGEKIGFFIRNGEQLFAGWTDEEYIKIYSEDAFLKSGYGETTEADGDMAEGKYKLTSGDEMASRFFVLSILQGILETEDIINLPKPVNVFAPDSTRIIFSYADNWITERKFGSFTKTMQRLNQKNKIGDWILVLMRLFETSTFERFDRKPKRGREDAWQNRTHDCRVSDGIHRINFIDDSGNVYVSAKKKWSHKEATSNFRINEGEYINITYWNSEWLRYYIVNKEIGHIRIGGQHVNYAHFVRFLNIAKQHITEREAEESGLIELYYPDLKSVRDWMVLLTHWKIINNVRFITDYQARRFAKYLHAGEIKILKHLHGDSYNFDWDTPSVDTIEIDYDSTGTKRNYYLRTNIPCVIYGKQEPWRHTEIDGVKRHLKRMQRTSEKNEEGETKYLCAYEYKEGNTSPEIIEKFKAIVIERTNLIYNHIINLLNKYGYSYEDIRNEARKRWMESSNKSLKTTQMQFLFIDKMLDSSVLYKPYQADNGFVSQYMELEEYDGKPNRELKFSEIVYYNELIKVYLEIANYVQDFETCKYESDTEVKGLDEYLQA